MTTTSIGIVGGSIIGLSTAAAILQDYLNIKVIVYSDKFSPHTTADVSAGYMIPHMTTEDGNKENIQKWANNTLEYLMEFAREDDEVSKAITIASGYHLWKRDPENHTDPYYVDYVFGRREVQQDELNRSCSKGRYAYAEFLTTYLCDCTVYLPCLMKKLKANGVEFVERKISSLDEVADMGHDIVVNAAGFGAKFLTGDTEIQPMRGHTLLVKAPWIKHFFAEEDGGSFILPKSDYLVVSGATEDGESPEDTSSRIWKTACKMVPALRNGRVIGERIGIRPCRSSVRIEIEDKLSINAKKYVILHHYGHGGFGIIVHWGSAKQAASMLKPYVS